MDTTSGELTAERASRPGGPLGVLAGLFSSVWLGIVLMVLLFVYSTIMSAGILYPSRIEIFTPDCFAYVVPKITWTHFQPRFYFDLTEMEAFSWWPFNLMLALFTVNLVVVTLRRIRLNWVNLGVWMIHAGILILIGGSVYYFGTKVEGDTPVYRRQLEIRVPGQDGLARLPVVPNNRLAVGGYSFRVQSTNPNYTLLTGEDKGKTAYAVSVAVTSPTQSFVRQLLAGYPEYTEDVIPGKGRAIKELGQPLVDEGLRLRLAFLPQDTFFVMDTGALYARAVGDPDWSQYPLEGLPHYVDRIGDRDWIWTAAGEDVPEIKPLDIRAATEGPTDPLEGFDVRVTGHLRYAPEMQKRFRPGGRLTYPVIGLRFHEASGSWSHRLEAFNPRAATAENGALEFRWVNSIEALERLEENAPATLHVEAPGADLEVPITETLASNPDLAFTPVAGTDYAYRIRGVVDRMVLDRGRFAGRPVSVAMVEIKTPERQWVRWVCDPPEATRDVSGEHQEITLDPGIVMRYDPPALAALVTFVAGPDPIGIHVFSGDPDKARKHQVLQIGERVEVVPGISGEVEFLYPKGQGDTRPVVTPKHLRRSNARAAYSRIRVEMRRGDWSQNVWLPYNAYALPDQSHSYPGRISYMNHILRLPDGRRVELLFSRQRRSLGTQVALERFELPTHTGGYITERATTVRDYVSRVRFKEDDGWTGLQTVRNNHPAEHEGWWYFQATWDPPNRAGQGGMNYTGLGVGNRNGVYIQLAGTIIAVLGMIYAFYVKPIIKRRRREAVWTQAGREWGATQTESAGAVAPEAATV